MTHPHRTTGKPCSCGFTKHKKPQRINKFFTGAKQHATNKALYNMRWGFPPKKGAVDPEFLEQYIREHGPYMYHGTTPEAARKIVKEGLYPHDHQADFDEGSRTCPNCGEENSPRDDFCDNCEHYLGDIPASRSPYGGGFLAPRSGHVYLGDYDTSSRYTENHTTPMLRVDLRKLDPTSMSADEDHFVTNRWHSPVVDKVHEYDPPPDANYHIPGEGQTLGEWADSINLGSDPEETHHSMTQGSMAYRGVVPPEAIEMDNIHRGWGGVKPSAETGWKAMHKDDYVAQPFQPNLPPAKSTQDELPNLWDIGMKAAATDSNHWEGKMWHGNNKGFVGAVRTPFWTTSHKPEALGFGDTVHPVSVRFKNPAYYFGVRTRGDIEMAQAAGNDGIVIHYPEDNRDPSDLYPSRQWAIALDPGTVVPGHDYEFPY